MKLEIRLDMKISELVGNFPECCPFFSAHGLGQLVSEKGLQVLAPFLTLETALRSRGVNPQTFLSLLKEYIADNEMLEAPGLRDFSSQEELNLLALVPCGVKVPFSRAICDHLSDLQQSGEMALSYAVEGNLNWELSYYTYLKNIQNLEELPDVIVCSDINAFYHSDFYQRFVKDGNFTDVFVSPQTDSFKNAGIPDPQHYFTVLAVNPLVIVAVLDKVGQRPLPTCWDDILCEHWEKDVTLRGNKDFFCHAVLTPIYQEHGNEGLLKLAANVRDGQHPAEMVKEIDRGKGGALYVMPEFFAQKIRRKEGVRIIWPDDGAMASPITLIVKKDRAAELQPVINYLTSVELARVFNDARCLTPHRGVSDELQEKKLRWIGWEFIRANDLATVNADIDEVFMPAVKDNLNL